MAQVSIGQVENLEDLVRELQSVREALEAACREQIAVAEQKCAEAREEAQHSASMLESAIEQAFGIFSPDINGPDPQEEALARRLQRKKKKKRRSRGIS